MKPTVRFSHALSDVAVGQSAAIYIVDPHPVLGEIKAPKWVHTSEIVSVDADGSFETLNTKYKKT